VKVTGLISVNQVKISIVSLQKRSRAVNHPGHGPRLNAVRLSKKDTYSNIVADYAFGFKSIWEPSRNSE
jgi:hypothetical protein